MSELNEGAPGEVKFSLWDQVVRAREMYYEATGNCDYDLISNSARAYWREIAKEDLLNSQSQLEPVSAVDPDHYDFPGGVQVIDITKHLDFLRGNAVKYLCRAGRKGDALTDLKKALRYVEWAIEKEEAAK